MSEKTSQNDPLEVFFDAAKGAQPAPSEALMARVLADAETLQPSPEPVAPKMRRKGWFSALGGWPALAGLATATVAGVSIGVADPASVGDIAFYSFADAYDFSSVGGLNLGLEDG